MRKFANILRHLTGWAGTILMVLPPGVPLLILVLLTSRGTYTDFYFTDRARLANSLIASLAVSIPILFKCFQTGIRKLDPEMLGIAGTLGMNSRTIFRRIVVPQCRFALLTGVILMAGRFCGEFLSDRILFQAMQGKNGTVLQIIGTAVTGRIWLQMLIASAICLGAGFAAAGICLLVRSLKKRPH